MLILILILVLVLVCSIDSFKTGAHSDGGGAVVSGSFRAVVLDPASFRLELSLENDLVFAELVTHL